MSNDYDIQKQNCLGQLLQTEQEESQLVKTQQNNSLEIQQIRVEVGRLEEKKKDLLRRIYEQQQQVPDLKSSNAGPGESEQKSKEETIKILIDRIQKQISGLTERLHSLEAQNVSINNSIAQIRQKRAEVLNRLAKLKSEQEAEARSYYSTEKVYASTRMTEAREAQKHLDYGASVARDHYRLAIQRVTEIDRIISQYSSPSGSHQSTGVTFNGQYTVVPRISNNYKLIEGKSIDSLVNSYSKGDETGPYEHLFKKAGSRYMAVNYRRKGGSYVNPYLRSRGSDKLSTIDYKANN